jgi:hypothetical protein
MKYLLIIITLFISVSCNQSKTKISTTELLESSIENKPFGLVGNYERFGEKEGQKTYESWTMNEAGEFIGIGCTLKGGDTIWKENIVLSEENGEWTFDVIGLGDTTTTSFLVTLMEKNRFICVNDLNEFPKKIEYAFDGKGINAEISGGGPTIPFNFKRLK